MYLYNYLLSALGLNSIPGSCLLESEFTGVLGNVNLMGFLTLNVVSVSKEISFLVSWHEWDTSSHESFGDVESGVLLVEIFVPVESCSVFAVKHETISVGLILEWNRVSGSINTGNDFPDVDFGSLGVVGKGSDVGEVVFSVVESSKFIASSDSHASENSFSLGWGMSDHFSTSFIVQSLLWEDWTFDTSDDSSPLMWFANLTGSVFLVSKSSSKESTGCSIFPHIVDWASSWSNLASWHGLLWKDTWESKLLKHVERSADFLASWWGWVNLDSSTISDPFSTLESIPVGSVILEDPAVVMPESFIPSPSAGGESSLGWAPVVPLVVIPSIPDFTIMIPFPDDWWGLCLLAPVANFRMSSILLDEPKAFLLGGQNVIVLSIDLFLASVIMLFGGSWDILSLFWLFNFSFKEGGLINLVHVLT